jgi:hypothetical protein
VDGFRRLFITTTLTFTFLSIPAAAQKVQTDYDHSVNFEQYRTYSWGKIQTTDPLFENRIRQAVDHDLQAKGWQQVPSGGNATLVAVGSRRNQAEYQSFYNSLGPGWGWRGWGGTGMTTTTVNNIPVGTLVLDFYDSNSKHLVWRGIANDQLSDKPEKNTQKLQKAIGKMLDKFPPRSS